MGSVLGRSLEDGDDPEVIEYAGIEDRTATCLQWENKSLMCCSSFLQVVVWDLKEESLCSNFATQWMKVEVNRSISVCGSKGM